MNIYEILAQIFGAIALLFLVLSYQSDKRNNFLLMALISDMFFAINFILLGAASGFATSLISVCKEIIFYRDETKKRKTSVITLLIIEIVIIIAGIFTYEGIVSLLPLIVCFIYTIGQWQTNLKVSYGIGVISGILLLTYNMFIGAYSAALSGVLELISSSTGLMKLVLKEKLNKRISK